MNSYHLPGIRPAFLETQPALSTLLLALGALSVVSLPLLLQLPLSVGVLFGLLLAVRVALLLAGVLAVDNRLLLPLLGAIVAAVWKLLGSIIGLQGGIAFLLLVALLKSYEGKSRRDWQVLVLAMLFLTAGSVLFDQGPAAGLWMLLCLVVMALVLALLNEMPWRPALRQSLTGFLLALPLMLLLFVAMPRRESPLWQMPNPQNKAVTGLSDRMKPGSISDLVQSNEPAFTATFDQGYMPQRQQLYWRVLTLPAYENGAWQAVRDVADDAVPQEGKRIGYQMIVADERGMLPALDYPPPFEKRGFNRELGNVLRVPENSGVRRVRLEALPDSLLYQRLTRGEADFYRRLPSAASNPRTVALARKLAAASNGSVERYAQSVLEYFHRERFAYTLQPPQMPDADATDRFLFEHRRGFCEHYADAFVSLMRAAGIPARVVTGYQGGEYDAEGGFWQVRSKDAHAWAEVWLPERQAWRRYDPTAAVSADRIEQGVAAALPSGEAEGMIANTGRWNAWLDRSRFYWQQWVVNYDDSRQKSLFASLGLGRVGVFSILALLALGALPVLLPVWLWWRRSRRQDADPLRDGFALLKYRLLGADYPELAAVGPQELRRELARQNRLESSLKALIDDYIRLNYAAAGSPAAAVAQAWFRRARRLSKKYRLADG